MRPIEVLEFQASFYNSKFPCTDETVGSKLGIRFFLVSEALLDTTPEPEAIIADCFLTDYCFVSNRIIIGGGGAAFSNVSNFNVNKI